MHQQVLSEFLSCDWGTTSFRLRWIKDGGVCKEYSDNIGCRALFSQSGEQLISREDAFARHLRGVLRDWSSPQPLPLIISGMASSTIGWKEVPYAALPLNIDGSDLKVENLAWEHPALVAETWLVSGAASDSEMMRGEESEAIGLLQLLPPEFDSATLILPGTHSKHLAIEHNAITGIQTFMTGELFELLSKHSVLAASTIPVSAPDPVAFKEGVDRAVTHGLAGSIFQTRTRHVLGKHSPQTNASFLSGVLIGSELLSLKSRFRIMIAGADSLRNLYAEAAQHLELSVSHIFSVEEVRLAVPRAHALILARLPSPR